MTETSEKYSGAISNVEHWRWRQPVSPKCWYACTKPDGVTFQKTLILVATAIRSLKPKHSDSFKIPSIYKDSLLQANNNFIINRLSV
jgi:hypothetical protein